MPSKLESDLIRELEVERHKIVELTAAVKVLEALVAEERAKSKAQEAANKPKPTPEPLPAVKPASAAWQRNPPGVKS